MATLRRLDDHNAEPRPVIGDPLTNALAGLRWSAERGEWSASVKPDECQALLDHMAELEAAAQGRWDAVHKVISAKQFTHRCDGDGGCGDKCGNAPVHPDTARAQATEADHDALRTLAAAGATGALLGIIAAGLRLP